MTEGIPESPSKLPNAEDRERIIKDWEAAFETRKSEIVEHDKIVELLERGSSPEAFVRDTSETLPGSFSFGESQEVFYVVYSHLCGEKAAREELEHEKEHLTVYEKHGVPVDFGIVISKLPDGNLHIIPLISPKFPKDMPPEQRKVIAYEANLAVTKKSERDELAIKKHKGSK